MGDFDLPLALGTEPGIPGKAVTAEHKCGGYFKRDEGEEDLKHDERHELNGFWDGLEGAYRANG